MTGSLTAVGCPRRSTEVRSSGALVSELRGVCGLVGWYPLEFTLGFGFDVVPAGALGELRVLAFVLWVAAGAAAPTVGTDTMVGGDDDALSGD